LSDVSKISTLTDKKSTLTDKRNQYQDNWSFNLAGVVVCIFIVVIPQEGPTVLFFVCLSLAVGLCDVQRKVILGDKKQTMSVIRHSSRKFLGPPQPV